MRFLSCIFFFLLIFIHRSLEASSPESSTYRAAVVEYNAAGYKNDSTRSMQENAVKIVSLIEQAAKQEADIVIFPELSLTSVDFPLRPLVLPWGILIPHPSQHYAPCNNFEVPILEPLRQIACAAEKNKIYVVLNLIEKELCLREICPTHGFFFYVTTVAFDRNGVIISRYRKSHLLDEITIIDLVEKPENSTFTTDFGVTFGNLICLDMMYNKPASDLIRELNVTDIIGTVGWFNQMPFRFSIQAHVGWAYTHDVNLLISGYNRAVGGYSGSGVYAGRKGILAALIALEDHDEILVVDVPKKSTINVSTPIPHHDFNDQNNSSSEDRGYQINNGFIRKNNSYERFKLTYEKYNGYKTELITQNGTIVKTLHQNGLYCEFMANVTHLNPPSTYRLMIFDDLETLSKRVTIGVRLCAIVTCINETLDSCGRLHNSSVIFNSITVTAKYIDNKNTTMQPCTLTTKLFPLTNWVYNEHKKGEYIYDTITLKKPPKNVLTFGIYGRNFEHDSPRSSSSTIFGPLS